MPDRSLFLDRDNHVGRRPCCLTLSNFLGLNTLAILAALAAVHASKLRQNAKVAVLGIWLLLAVSRPAFDPIIFELAKPVMKWHEHGTFKEAMCAIAVRQSPPWDKARAITDVPIYPWEGAVQISMKVPTQLLIDLKNSKACDVSSDVLQ